MVTGVVALYPQPHLSVLFPVHGRRSAHRGRPRGLGARPCPRGIPRRRRAPDQGLMRRSCFRLTSANKLKKRKTSQVELERGKVTCQGEGYGVRSRVHKCAMSKDTGGAGKGTWVMPCPQPQLLRTLRNFENKWDKLSGFSAKAFQVELKKGDTCTALPPTAVAPSGVKVISPSSSSGVMSKSISSISLIGSGGGGGGGGVGGSGGGGGGS